MENIEALQLIKAWFFKNVGYIIHNYNLLA